MPKEETVYKFKIEGNIAVLDISGNIDVLSSQEFEKQVTQIFSKDFKTIKFNFRNVPYISSSGLRVVLYTKQELLKKDPNSKLIIQDPSPNVMEVLNMTGFSDKVVNVEYSKQ